VALSSGDAAMTLPPGWQNPITTAPGQIQTGVDPRLLLPARRDLIRARLAAQRALLQSGQPRHTMIQVTPDGVIWDGHHGVRAAAELGRSVDVLIVAQAAQPVAASILALPVR